MNQSSPSDINILYNHYQSSINRIDSLNAKRNRSLVIFYMLELCLAIFALNAELVLDLINGVLTKTYNITLVRNNALLYSAVWVATLFYAVQFIKHSGDITVLQAYLVKLNDHIASKIGFQLKTTPPPASETNTKLVHQIIGYFDNNIILFLPFFLNLFLMVHELTLAKKLDLFIFIDCICNVFLQLVLASYFFLNDKLKLDQQRS